MKRRFLSLLLCLLMVFALPISSHAITGTSEGIVTYGQSKPSKAWNWSDGAYQFSGHGNMSDLYSNYYFTGAKKFEITVRNYHSEKLTVKLLKRQTGVDWSASTKKIDGGKNMTWSVSVDSSSEYILKFYAPSNFTGSIKKIS